MKILVPTDFSETSGYAVQMASRVASKTDSKVDVFHAIEGFDQIEKIGLDAGQIKDYQTHLHAWATEKLKETTQPLIEDNIVCEFDICKGDFISCLQEKVENSDYDLVIMGSNGSSGREEWLMGSNAKKAVRKLRKKILIVKQPIEELTISEVVFVTGLHQSDKVAFQEFLDFVRLFDVKEIHIMTVNTSSFFSQPTIIAKEALEEFADLSKIMDIRTHFYQDNSVQAGIEHFQQDYQIDLIGISNHVRHPIKRFFSGSTVELLVASSDIPVLSIDFL